MNEVHIFKLISFLMPLVCILIIIMVLVLIPSFPDLQERGLCLSQLSAVEGRSVVCEQTRIPFLFSHVLQSKYEELQKAESERTDSSDYVIYLKHDLETKAMSMKPAARYTGRSLTDREIKEGRQMPESLLKRVPAWRPGRKSYDTGGYERYGMTMDRGWVTVPVAGIYHIYSSVEFYEEFDRTGPEKGFDTFPLVHALFKYNVHGGFERKLVGSEQPHMQPQSRAFNVYTSFLTAVVELKAGDEVSVKVSNLTYLRDTRFNCFGVYLV